MRQCTNCRDERGRPIHGYYSWRDRLRRRAGGCNWLDGDGPTCPHCGRETAWFEPAPLGALMDSMSMESWVLDPEEDVS